MFESVLVDHGFTPTAIVTRLTHLSAPDSVQPSPCSPMITDLGERLAGGA